MVKLKTERNISALDYLYKKLYRLENKIEALSRGKINKRDLLIYTCVGIFWVKSGSLYQENVIKPVVG